MLYEEMYLACIFFKKTLCCGPVLPYNVYGYVVRKGGGMREMPTLRKGRREGHRLWLLAFRPGAAAKGRRDHLRRPFFARGRAVAFLRSLWNEMVILAKGGKP